MLSDESIAKCPALFSPLAVRGCGKVLFVVISSSQKIRG